MIEQRPSLMAAQVTSLASMLRENEEGEGKKELVTRDLLGVDLLGVGGVGMMHPSADVDLELRVPAGWERRRDLASGRTYLHKSESNRASRLHNDLHPTLRPPSCHLFLDLEVKSPPLVYQSVCTLEKVKSALERAVREKRFPDSWPSTPSSSTIITSSTKRKASDDRSGGSPGPESPTAAMVVAGCPVCLLYVFVSAAKPRCPRCAAHVPIHSEPHKRHKFDLNATIQDGESWA